MLMVIDMKENGKIIKNYENNESNEMNLEEEDDI